ncbi:MULTISPECIES: acyltransferase family protein [Mycobacterium]|uniref:Acyltransferase n=1 Tax=Mycobacterium kiyosense TaxID=2871094 RepID=A0A9P3Q6U0_9MYCO|nr:acyltransferase [Mycobacterium sp. 20KCMC460]GLB81932.1 acyltransferase [Mycobacterium kiyosense]GLB88108.1 acyltransferase [Mycobacterium kiyosense]GLB95668.1 acyltransferase [Mycobacterium kiyosense]GLC01145.1 acyltransferase [Mycobacterium kiyosense]
MGFPSPTDLQARTPNDRDRAIDVIRITALVGVVLGHTVMATSMIRGGLLVWDNLLSTSTVFQALTWVFQIMPLFFFAGTAACVQSWRPGMNWGGWLMKRCTRLFRPVFYYLAFWAVALTALDHVAPLWVYKIVAGVSIQLLWFLGVYVLVLAAIPALSLITTPVRLAAAVATVYTMVAVIDVVRLHWSGLAPLGYLNLATWLIPGMFGVAYRRQLITGRAALGIAAALFAADIGLLTWGPYELSLVGIEGQRLANMSPPSLLLAGHAIVLSALAIAAAPAINRWAQRPRVWWLTTIGNSGAMTLYLWHMPALLGVHLLFDSLGHPRYPTQPDFLAVTFAQLFVVFGLVAVLFVALRGLENHPLPGWDGSPAITSAWRGTGVGVLLCVAGAAVLAAVKWGLKDEGLICVSVMLTALVAARALAGAGAPAEV